MSGSRVYRKDTRQYFYAFYMQDDSPIPFYDRTFADQRTVLEWCARGKGRFFTINCLPEQYWY